jgi:hypothetical protein
MEMARHLLFEFRQDRRLRELRGWRLGWYVVRQLGAKMRRNLPQAYGRGWWFGLGTGFLLTALLHAFVALIALRLVGQAEHRRAVFATLAGAALIGAALIGVSLGALGGFVTGAMRLWQIFSVEVPQNFFGLCNGSRDEPPDRNASSAPVLTDWLSEQIDRVARGDEQWADAAPLTFRELAEQGIVLQMVTTNLSHHQPYRVPFRDNIFLFNEADLDRLFPPRVVHYMKEAAYQSARRSGRVIPPPGFHFLPEGDKLPVAVGMRLSLSFPILLSMVRLYTINTRAFLRRRRGQDLQLTPDDLQPNWFSDGGISSNFPIHFFDRWLPDHHTFGF